MQKWEYKTICEVFTPEQGVKVSADDRMNQLGQEGWECIAYQEDAPFANVRIVLRLLRNAVNQVRKEQGQPTIGDEMDDAWPKQTRIVATFKRPLQD